MEIQGLREVKYKLMIELGEVHNLKWQTFSVLLIILYSFQLSHTKSERNHEVLTSCLSLFGQNSNKIATHIF